VVLAGPAMNLAIPVLLFAVFFMREDRFHPAEVGRTPSTGRAYGLLRPGDKIRSVGGASVDHFADVQAIVAKHPEEIVRVGVEREGKLLEIDVRAASVRTSSDPLDEPVGRLGISPRPLASVVGVARSDSPAARAGLRTFDRIVSVGGVRIDRFEELVTKLSQNRGESVSIGYLRGTAPQPGPEDFLMITSLEAGLAQLTPTSRRADATLPQTSDERLLDMLERTGLEPANLYVAAIVDGSSEWQAGLRLGDRIEKVDGVTVTDAEAVEDRIGRAPSTEHTIQFVHLGTPREGKFSLRQERWTEADGDVVERFVPRMTLWRPASTPHWVKNDARLLHGLRRGFAETVHVSGLLVRGLRGLVRGELPLESIGGPVLLYEIAGEAGARGLAFFCWALAVLSINLGLLNLLPVPILDGGQLAFLAFEGVRRKPVGAAFRDVASIIGVVLLLAITVVSVRNDLSRRWDDVVRDARRGSP
jgi:regulator of sigma E protease